MIQSDLTTLERFHGVRAENSRGIFASEGPNFKGAIFGRDSLEAAEDIIVFDQVIPKEVLLTLASLQGLEEDDVSEEELGRIHHEARFVSDVPDEGSLRIYRELAEMWGGSHERMVYYGSVDATPLFVRLAVRFVQLYGDNILYERIIGRDGNERPFSDHLLMAKDWIVARIDRSDIGFIEYKRTNPRGIENQVWKDSKEAYIHLDGRLVNFDGGPVAPIEAQGYAYDALKGMSSLFPGSVRKGLVESLGERIMQHFWLKDERMFTQAIDRDSAGRLQPVRVPSSNAGLLLDSDVLKDLAGKKPMVKATVDMLMSTDFLTDAGIRCRSLKFANLIDFPDYHGSYAVWFKETMDIISGFKRHGFGKEARRLAQRLVDTIEHLGEYYEFVFVDEAGRIIPPSKPTGVFADQRCSIPEPGQTWTISAFLHCLRLLQNN